MSSALPDGTKLPAGWALQDASDHEEAAAERNTLDPDVAESYAEQAKRGANVKGEGAIE